MSRGREIATWAPDGSGAWIRNVNDDWRDAGDWMGNITNNTFHSYRDILGGDTNAALDPCIEHEELTNGCENNTNSEIQLNVDDHKNIDIICAQTGASRAEAIQAYIEENRDIVDAVLKLA